MTRDISILETLPFEELSDDEIFECLGSRSWCDKNRADLEEWAKTHRTELRARRMTEGGMVKIIA